MEDITPGLIDAITSDFREVYGKSKSIQDLLEKVRAGTATYAEAQTYSINVSRLIGAAYEKHVSSAVLPDGRMYYNIASRLIPSTMDENYRLVSDYAAAVQQRLNEKAKIGIKAQVPEENQDRVDGLVEMASNAEQYDRIAGKLLAGFENFSQNIVDETIKANAEYQYKAGLRPRIIRKAERKCCGWCAGLAGEYEYPDVPRDVYRRHENCRCTVTYDPADGKGKSQDVWTKKWTEPEENDKILKRQVIGLKAGNNTVKGISDHALQRIRERNVAMDAVIDALEYPLKTTEVRLDAKERPSVTFTGKKATVSVNPETGIITTVYPTHTKTAEKLMIRK